MSTPTTEHSYPPIDSQGIYTFITDQGGTLTGDLQTDFRNALFIAVAPGGKANDYSIDDLWQRHIIANVAGDANAEAGNPAADGRGKSGFVGNSLHQYYGPPFLKNPGNANAFPGAGASGIAQNLIFERKAGANVTLSNGGLTMVGSTGNWFYACPGAVEDSDSSKLRAGGGKWMYEITIDNYPATNAFCSVGFGNDTTAQFDTVVAGNGNGCALLVDDENGTLSRLYYGANSGAFVNASNPSFPLDAGGTVVTMGIDLDLETVSAYMDGVLVHTRGYLLNGAEDDRIVPVVKSMFGTQMTLNTTVQYPIDGYTVWK